MNHKDFAKMTFSLPKRPKSTQFTVSEEDTKRMKTRRRIENLELERELREEFEL